MKKTLTQFRIWSITSLGIGCFYIKASSHLDAFKRLGKTDKSKCTSIEDLETDERKTIEDILGLELI